MEKRQTGFLIDKKDGQKDFIFGSRAIIEAIAADQEIDKILIQKDLQNDLIKEVQVAAKSKRILVVKVPAEKLNKVTKKNHQGVIAYMSAINYASLDNVIQDCYQRGKDPLLLILDRVTDVRNFGAIVRTAECAGADAIIIPEKGSAQINSDAVKTSAGALNHLPICRVKTLAQTVSYLQNNGIRTVACTEKSDKDMYFADLTSPLAIIMGSEEDGISPDLLSMSDLRVRIPLQGKIASLNVSVSAAVIVYEAVRQRFV